ncbi:hypothetical protein [Kurthia huakuii]|uniref:hypothetical protein n=1 Tax=Kurthia huakuii TaxID=1421019 RepID=UPI0004977670|nr:hypothetical protein [Kurthia huakuii]MBM7701062.1 hypothetical protein [Kurthia huakuii]
MYKEFYFTKAHDGHVLYESEIVKRDELMVMIQHNETLPATDLDDCGQNLRSLMTKATYTPTEPSDNTPYLSVIYDDLDSANEQFYYLNVTAEELDTMNPQMALALIAEHTPFERNFTTGLSAKY